MPCYYPVGTHDKFMRPLFRPCGRCIGCRLEVSRQWAVRCVHESQLHDESAFVTLTYNEDNLPVDGSISKQTLHHFIRRLRHHAHPAKIRYFACGEYGKNLSRPHYHILIFGFDFSDKYLFYLDPKRASKKKWIKGHDHTLYRSNSLEKLWTYGFSSIGDLTYESANYCARYVCKKINGKMFESHYKNRTPEFALMSRRPGIGAPWLKKYLGDVYPKDYFTINGRKHSPPRYYDYLLSLWNPKLYYELKEKRREVILETRDKHYQSHKRLREKEVHKELITKTLNRRI
jgi:hypothetical protein